MFSYPRRKVCGPLEHIPMVCYTLSVRRAARTGPPVHVRKPNEPERLCLFNGLVFSQGREGASRRGQRQIRSGANSGVARAVRPRMSAPTLKAGSRAPDREREGRVRCFGPGFWRLA
jgi:hypothetical protein